MRVVIETQAHPKPEGPGRRRSWQNSWERFELLYRSSRDDVFAYVATLLKDRAAAEDVTALRPRYVELLSEATKVEPAAADYLGDIDGGFYASEYLRAWAFEAQLRAYLRERFGNAWFSRREAGSLLRELWAEGQKPTADELLRDVTGETLELAAVGDRIREALAAI